MDWLPLFGGLLVVVYGGLGLMALRRPLLARVAIREATRRPLQSALVIAGLMVASGAIFTGQLLTNSTYDSYTAAAAKAWGRTDLMVSSGGAFFDSGVAQRLAADSRVKESGAGVQAGIEVVGAVAELDRRTGRGFVPLVGFDPSTQPAFGSYILQDGRQTSGADLSQGGVLLSRSLADSLRAHVGDRLTISVGEAPSPVAGERPVGGSTVVTVAGIARSEGPGAYGLRPSVYAPLAALQPLTGSGLINVVRIAGRGEGTEEIAAAHGLLPAVRDVLAARQPGGATLSVREAKADDVSVEAASWTSQAAFWTVLPFFVMAGGIALAVNLAVALAVERRPRLAILRALGLSRAGMIAIAVMEGALYSIAAAFVGIVPGLLAGWWIDFRYGATAGPGHYLQMIPGGLSIRPASLILSVAVGALLPLATILAISLSSSRMSISAAIRDLPEPVTPAHGQLRRYALALVLGLISLVAVTGNPGTRLFGGVGLIVAVVLLMSSRPSARARATAAGAVLTAWALVALGSARSMTNNEYGAQLAIGGFVIAVFGLSILVTANLRGLEAASGLLGSASGARAIMRPALAYTTRRPVRAGLAIGTFGLLLSYLTVNASLLGTFTPPAGAAGEAVLKRIGAPSIMVTTAGSAAISLPPALQSQALQQETILTRAYLGPIRSSSPTAGNPAFALDWHQELVPLYELSAAQFQDPPIHLTGRDPRFLDDAAVWRALRDDPTWVVSNRFGETTTLTLMGPSGPVQRRVAASYIPGFLYGIAGSKAAFTPFNSAPLGSTLLIKTPPGTDSNALASQIDGAPLPVAVDASPVLQLNDRADDAFRAFVGIPAVFMRLGLLVGVLSLGILAYRAMVERRHAIGVLRALGYRRKDLVAGMLAEAGLLLTTGVVIGVGIGLIGAYLYVRIANPGTTVGLDVGDLGTTLLALYAAVFLATIGPALQASRLPPAQALRLLE